MAKKTHQIALTSLEIRCQSGSFATASFGMSTSGRGKGRGRQEAAQPLHARTGAPVFELAAAAPAGSAQNVDLGRLLVRRPVAAIALVPKPALLFAAGAVAGALGKTLTAPLDRVKLLLQTRGGLQGGALKAAARGGGVWDALVVMGREEGFLGYWKGNVPQILKVVPYSAIQLCSYEAAKRYLRNKETGDLSVPARLAAGAFAGMTATLATYPLDTLRLRLAVDPASRSVAGAARALMREGSHRAFFRGLGASMMGIAPYMALELAVFDLMPKDVAPFVRGFSSALLATTLCYPLDTVRRQIQLQSTGSTGPLMMAQKILHREGLGGFYRGFLPNALKNLPNKGVRLAVFDGAKKLLTTAEQAYKEELEKANDSSLYRLK
ncbi:probable envelope ADP,ATP carrier protein, chloroplastic [Coccomyxa sp. Obi]|nr:probable envelope ADP,ATP carrier protein, chloroplastic [Coccomyxa sp. Obi]